MSKLKLMGLAPGSTAQCLVILDSWVILTAYSCHVKSPPAVTDGGKISSICNKMAIKRLLEVLLPGII